MSASFVKMGHAFVCLLVLCGVIAAQEFTTFGYKTDFFTDETTTADTPTVSVPTKPKDLRVLGISPTSIALRWNNPDRNNGVIEGYRVYYMYANFTEVQPDKIKHTSPYVHYNLTKLKPNTDYKIWVKAYTRKHEGEPSDPVFNTTDIPAPSEPESVVVGCETEQTIYINWNRPRHFYMSIDYYYVYVALNNKLWENITMPASKEHLEISYKLNVTPNALYEIQIQASTWSNYTSRLVFGPLSVLKKVNVKPFCDKEEQTLPRTTADLQSGIVVGCACAIAIFIITVTGFLVWKKCFKATYYYLYDPPLSVPTACLDWNQTPEPESEAKGAIAVEEFAAHVEALHKDGDIAFSKEYEAIQALSTSEERESELSQHPDNRAKNRYLNIIAYDHSRVPLLPMTNQKKLIDYINANFIDGFQWNNAYIGTQGPLPSTFDCFWRMVWEQRVSIIVMITNLVERGRRKCDMYWPKEGTETYGFIQVRLVKENVMATYTVRTLQIRHLRVKSKKTQYAEKIVYQYHYTNWPDHGTPDHPLPVLHFVKKSAGANPPGAGPIIVHCSAGVGRTGTYIVLDAMLKQIYSRSEVNIYGFLKHIRSQRNFLVQTEEQYIFIHDALLEAIESGETSISRDMFPQYVETIKTNQVDPEHKLWKPMQLQYDLATSFKSQDFNLLSAKKAVNQPKNRCTEILPIESSRVHLTPKPGEDGSDYINATWMQGFHSLREYIITQHPLHNTVLDFWQMVWDHSSQLIVMLSIIDNEDFEVFWPVEEETIDTDTFKIRLAHEQIHGSYVTRDFIMKSVQDDYEVRVKMIHCNNWPHNSSNISEIYEIPNVLLENVIQNGPIVVVDKFGGTEAATFCALTTLKKQLIFENSVDIYMYTKLIHTKRPNVWSGVEDYLRMHVAVQSLCTHPDEGTIAIYLGNPNGDLNGDINGSVSAECVRVSPEEEFPGEFSGTY